MIKIFGMDLGEEIREFEIDPLTIPVPSEVPEYELPMESPDREEEEVLV